MSQAAQSIIKSMEEIKTKTIYICPETGKNFTTKEAAKKSAEKAIALKNQRKEEIEKAKLFEQENIKKKDWLRLNLEDIHSLSHFMQEKMLEFWGIRSRVLVNHLFFGEISNSNHSPIGEKTNWAGLDKNRPVSHLGWRGRADIAIYEYESNGKTNNSVNEIFFSNHAGSIGFNGFYCGCGCPGVPNEYRLEMDINFFLQDFPKLQEKYDALIIESNKLKAYKLELLALDEAASRNAQGDPEIIKLNSQISDLVTLKDSLFNKLYIDYIDNNPKTRPQINPDYENIKRNFPGINILNSNFTLRSLLDLGVSDEDFEISS